MQRPCPLLAALLIFCGTLLAQTNPIPFVNQPLIPQSAAPGGGGFKLTVNGTGFVSGATVAWNGSARPTTFVSDSQLQAQISASDISSAMTAAVTVVNPSPGGGVSNTANFEVTLPAPGIQMWRSTAFLTKRFSAVALTAADFNRDGNLDVAVLSDAEATTNLIESTFFSATETARSPRSRTSPYKVPSAFTLTPSLPPISMLMAKRI